MVNKAKLTEGNIKTQLIKLTVPMILGMMSIVVFNLVDTYFVGRLGPEQLAAISFTFPVVLTLNSLSVGIGLGCSAILSKIIGENKFSEAQSFSTSGILLGVVINIIIAPTGILTINKLFSLLGASEQMLVLIRQYMTIWYIGTISVVIPMIGNNILRATGNTKIPGLIMFFSALLNTILDPLLIFGIGVFPKMGIQGAALATVIARSTTAAGAIYILKYKEHLLSFKKLTIKKIIVAWKGILYIGIPNAMIKMLVPVAVGIVTKLLSSYGPNVVAGYGVATRVEFFALAFTSALASVMGPFIGQNLGAKNFKRVSKSKKIGEIYSLVTGIILTLLLFFLRKPIAGIFTDTSEIMNITSLYLLIVPISYGVQGILQINTTILNVLNKPFHATSLIFFQMFIIYIPLALLGSNLFQIVGIFGALALSYFISGTVGHLTTDRQLENYILSNY